ncbi:MAG TPA: hypothetical protein PKA27_15200 [Fimbriimonadaceae bacterium]|nr:hypothetical protein [Fimbriimonadaceae bacterium]
MARIQRSHASIEKELQECIEHIRSSAQAYDEGRLSEAKRIAVEMRKLFHDGRGRSKSLMTQLDLWQSLCLTRFDSDPPSDVFLMPSIIQGKLSGGDPPVHEWVAFLNRGSYRAIPFADWWRDAIWVQPTTRASLSRQSFAVGMADQEGAHVDSDLELTYDLAKRGGGMMFLSSDGYPVFAFEEPSSEEALERATADDGPSLVAAVLRQMAHELLNSELCLPGDYAKVRGGYSGPILTLRPKWLPKEKINE